ENRNTVVQKVAVSISREVTEPDCQVRRIKNINDFSRNAQQDVITNHFFQTIIFHCSHFVL
ncbi:MAG: hypothetical protein LUQ38_08375, partial [Methanotrichaceae archaeon]|nr:hypothetical protein [Methanotrichaceae archaeon]